MLKQRVITAIIMLLIFLPALFYSSAFPFFLITLILIAAGAWEWGRLSNFSHNQSLVFAAVVLLVCVTAWRQGALGLYMPEVWILAGSSWVFFGAWMLLKGSGQWIKIPPFVKLLVGAFVLVFAWLAMGQARTIGISFLLSVLALVWIADIFAYFAGRALGGRIVHRKLAPSISPGKSWEGVCGGLLGVVVFTFVWVSLEQFFQFSSMSFFTYLGQHGLWFLLISVTFLTAMSVVGDLFESLMKRSAGVKDSSGLLPGHGGVLDRLDAMLPALPIAMMLYSGTGQ